MNICLSVQQKRKLAVGFFVLPMLLATSLSAPAFAVPLENAHDYVYGRFGLALTEAGKLRLLSYDKFAKPVFVHGPTMITMDYIALRNNGHEPVSGSTDPADQKKLALAQRRIPSRVQTSGLSTNIEVGDDGGGPDDNGGNLGGGGIPGGPGGGGGGPGDVIKNPVSPVPLPATLPMMLSAFAGLAMVCRRKKASVNR
jgi:hypothetical protein